MKRLARVPVGRPAALARGAAAGASVLVVAAELAAGPSALGLTLAGLATLAALLAAVLPRGLVPAAVLLLLVGEHLSATADLTPGARTAVAVPTAAALWLVHALFGLAAAVPLDADVDRTVGRRWLVRQRDVLLLSVPTGAVAAVLAGAVPYRAVLAVLAAAALVALPLVLVRQAEKGQAARNRRSTPSGTSSRTSA